MTNLTVYPKQLARQWILHINTTIRKVEIKAKFTKLTNKKKIEGQLWNKICIKDSQIRGRDSAYMTNRHM